MKIPKSQKKEFELIIEALTYMLNKRMEYEGYPDLSFKNKQVDEVKNIIIKLKKYKYELTD